MAPKKAKQVSTYKEAGVDIDLATELLTRVKKKLASTKRPEMLAPIGGFGGLFQIDLSKYKQPVFVSSIDGVGTKLMVAALMQKFDTVGHDIVNHCVNDISVQGAEPVFFLDYIGIGKLRSPLYEDILGGIADACKTYDMRYIMTSPDHDTPTGRIWEVSTVEDADLYLQLMGDEPLVNPAAFDLILPDTLPDDPYYVAVLTNIMEHPADVIDFSNQKVVTNAAREILLISRSPIPYPKGTLDFEYEKVTGIQLYSKQALKFYHDTPKSILEKAEENDMMRFIENGHKVHAIVSPYKTVSVDTPKDLALVNEILKEKQHG